MNAITVCDQVYEDAKEVCELFKERFQKVFTQKGKFRKKDEVRII